MAWLEAGVGVVRTGRETLSYLLLAVVLLGGSACKRGDGPAPGADPAPGASQPAEDPKTPKKVTKKDCVTWAEHGAATFVSSVVTASAGCPADAREGIRKKFEGEIVTLRGGAESLCVNHLEESYLAGDAACFMKANDALSMRACRFAPMTSADDTDWGGLLKTIHDRCGMVGAAAASAGSAAPRGSSASAP